MFPMLNEVVDYIFKDKLQSYLKLEFRYFMYSVCLEQ